MSPQSDHGQDLFRLTYVSRAVLPVLARFDATAQEIVQVAQDNNRKLGVTSFLVAHRGWFIQALEGPRRALSMVFAAIEQDLRHAQVELLGFRGAQQRLFDTDLAVKFGAPVTALDLLGLTEDFDPFKIDEATALSLMTIMATEPAKENARR